MIFFLFFVILHTEKCQICRAPIYEIITEANVEDHMIFQCTNRTSHIIKLMHITLMTRLSHLNVN